MKHLFMLAASLLLSMATTAQNMVRNPMIWADVPDPDVIRVGDTYYMVSTTMHLMPGGPVFESKDLAHWSLCSYLFDRLSDSPLYDLEGGTSYGRGQWATSLKYGPALPPPEAEADSLPPKGRKGGAFYALFSTNDPQGGADSYVFTTTDPHRGWTLHSRLPHFHDPSLFFDDDGRVYVFHGSGMLTELQPDLKGVRQGGTDQLVIGRDREENALLEGSRVIKKDGKYYVLMISWPKDKPRRQLCYRADRITGPYGKAVVLEDNFAGFPYVGQGTIVDAAPLSSPLGGKPDGSADSESLSQGEGLEGAWYAIIFQDRNAIGRVPLLIPVRWDDGWPMLDKVPETVVPALSSAVTATVPEAVVPALSSAESQPAHSPLTASDDFQGYPLTAHSSPITPLRPQWQWNHNPVNTAWSLTERKGWLRLKTSRVVDHLYTAPNTLSQRMEGPECSATVCIDFSKMRDGDRAGFAAFNGHSGVLVISRDGGLTTLAMQAQTVNFSDAHQPDNRHAVASVDVEEKEQVVLKGKRIYLRIDGDFRLGRDIATFYYSTDGKQWHTIGQPFQMRFDYTRLFMGTRYALFNYATRQTGGHIDIDYFRLSHNPSLNGEGNR